MNSVWRLLFPRATITHLTALISNHRPRLLKSNRNPHSHPKLLLFGIMWIRDYTFFDVIQEACNLNTNGSTLFQISSCLKATKFSEKVEQIPFLAMSKKKSNLLENPFNFLNLTPKRLILF